MLKRNPSRPGPVGTSCLTCKRRRKKCDRTRPVCERCSNSGIVCLGYGHLNNATSSSSDGQPFGSLDDINITENTSLFGLVEQPSSQLAPSLREDPTILYSSLVPQNSEKCSSLHMNSPDSFPGYAYQQYLMEDLRTDAIPFNNVGQASSANCSLIDSVSTGAVVYPSATLSTPTFNYASPTEAIRRALNNLLHALRSIPSPHSTYLAPDNAGQIINFVLTQHEELLKIAYFKPIRKHMEIARSSLALRLRRSHSTRLMMLLGCQIFQSFLDGTTAEKFPGYVDWLNRFDDQLHSADWDPSSTASSDRLTASLEVAFMRLRLFPSTSVHQILKKSAATFLQIALTEQIWKPSSSSASGLVSAAHVFTSTRQELSHFMLFDSLCSMVYGLPQVIHYDTSVPPLKSEIHPIEWVHGCPVVFQITLIEINSLFHQNQAEQEVDWRPIEQRLQLWQPVLSHVSGDDDSWKTIARVAIQESWRHTLLVYLHMTLGGARSDDPRVQSSVQQIFKLVATIQYSKDTLINFHLLAQYLIAGVCAQTEKHRTTTRERLGDVFDNGLWIIQGSDFVPVLDYLWHGAAANGRSIRWSDYVSARQIMLPVPV